MNKALTPAPIQSQTQGRHGSATGWLLLAPIYLVFIQPLHLFVMPLIGYDEDRLLGGESIYMLSVSAGAWRDFFVVIYGFCVGATLWRSPASAPRLLRSYLTVSLLSAFILLALPFLVPFHSFLRKPIRVEQTERFAVTLIVCGAYYLFLNYKRIWVEFCPRTEPELDGAASANFRRVTLARAGIAGAGILGIGLSVAAYFTVPIDVFEGAWEGNLKAVEDFVAKGEDVNSTIADGSIPLHLASTKDIAQFLISMPSKIEEAYLLTVGDIINLQALVYRLRAPADPVSQHIWSRLSPLTQSLLKDSRATWVSIQNPLVEDLNKILREGFLYDSQRFARTALCRNTLLMAGRNPQGIEQTHLGRLLLEDSYPAEIGKYHIDWRNHAENTPLHTAAFNARLEVASVLIVSGANVNARNWHGMTPLDVALFAKAKRRQGNFEAVIALLVEKGGRTNTSQNWAGIASNYVNGRYKKCV